MFDTCKTTKSVNYCYESMIARALAHIAKVGIPDECPQDCIFDCCKNLPTSETETKINYFLIFNRLEKAFTHLHIHTIGASMIVFSDFSEPT